tara:strand:+ start:178 stop:1215 length:1038 start_codon:yes stop_codon:yes gene_type:complete
VNKLLNKIEEISPKSILVITGKNSYLKSDFYSELILLKHKYEVKVWNYKWSYPDFNLIDDFIKHNNLFYDLIISYGGGTVIDVSKLLSISNNFYDFNEVLDGEKIKTSINHLCIPTTFGSGSESTSFAVMYKNKFKYSIQSSFITPNHIILNYRYTLNLNGKPSYCCIFDSFCQSIESLWSINNTDESSKYALNAIKLISPILRKIKNLSSSNRQDLLLASHLSGKAINITKTTAPHAFSYYLTTNHNICHGEAVSIIFEKFIDLNFNYISENNRKEILKYLNLKNKKEFILFFESLKRNVGFKLSLNDIEDLNLKNYSESINTQRLKNNPVKINPRGIIYDSMQ